jgi:N-acetylmuramoyl-L-alanine amidase
MRPINFIVLHCTAGPQTQTVEDIAAYWRNVLGWHTPGYHHEIDPTGKIHDLLPIEKPSNGVKGHNANSIHISYIGGVEMIPGISKSGVPINVVGRPIDNRTAAQIASQKLLIDKYTTMFPNAVVLGHRDFSVDKNRDGILEPDEWIKACPAFSVKEWMATWFKSKLPPILMTTTAANIRTGAGTNFPKVAAALPEDAVVKYLGEADGWTYVSVKGSGITGWVKSEYLKS